MQLTGELKEKVEKTETKEEAKKAIEDAGMLLSDAELDQVAGGQTFPLDLHPHYDFQEKHTGVSN